MTKAKLEAAYAELEKRLDAAEIAHQRLAEELKRVAALAGKRADKIHRLRKDLHDTTTALKTVTDLNHRARTASDADTDGGRAISTISRWVFDPDSGKWPSVDELALAT